MYSSHGYLNGSALAFRVPLRCKVDSTLLKLTRFFRLLLFVLLDSIRLLHLQQGIQALQSRHLNPLLPRQANGITENHLELHLLPALPIKRHARLTAARIPLCRAQQRLRCGELGGQRRTNHLGRSLEHLVHDALQVPVQLRVVGHFLVRRAARQHGRRVHRRVDRDLVPPHPLQLLVRVGFRVLDAATQEELVQNTVLGACSFPCCSGRGVGEIRSDVDPRPAVVLDVPVAGLGCRCDRYGTQDRRLGEPSCIGLLDT